MLLGVIIVLKKKTKQLLISTVGAAGLLLASAQAVSANTTAEVHQGDTVWGIAHNNNVSIQSIETLNKISPKRILFSLVKNWRFQASRRQLKQLPIPKLVHTLSKQAIPYGILPGHTK